MSRLRAIVLDVEGTTTSIVFVKDVLFPYARRRLRSFVAERRQDAEVRRYLDEARALATQAATSDDEVLQRLESWMDEDRKIGPLKGLQGHVWHEGYARGELVGHVYPDVPPALEAWTAAGLRLCIFSSGSVLAQRLLFAHSIAGDLTRRISAHFDTGIGAKREPASYGRITASIETEPRETLFVSDSAEELDAARSAGLRTVCIERDGPTVAHSHPICSRLDRLELFAELGA